MQSIISFIREHLILNIIWLSLLVLIILFAIQKFFSKYTIIQNEQTIKLINQKNGIIIDTRLKKLFDISHVENSIHVSLENILLGKINELAPYKSFPIILIMSELNMLKKCTEILYTNGFHDIYVLENGIDSLNIEDFPLVSTKM